MVDSFEESGITSSGIQALEGELRGRIVLLVKLFSGRNNSQSSVDFVEDTKRRGSFVQAV